MARLSRSWLAFGVGLVSSLAFFGCGVAAEVRQSVSLDEAAALLIHSGKLAEAKEVLSAQLAKQPDDRQALFLSGLIAVSEHDYPAAVEAFRSILISEPNADRVRLELGRAFFLMGDYTNAERQFRFARAGDLPDAVKANVDIYLANIARMRRWQYRFSVAVAPDTNVNGGTGVRQITIYGLPFELSSDARGTSGVGLTLDTGGEWSPFLTNNIKGRFGADIHRSEYSGGKFDDMTVSAYAGPEWVAADWDVSLLSTWFRRWYGNVDYSEAFGGLVSVSHPVAEKLYLNTGLSVKLVDYVSMNAMSGPVFGLDASLLYTLSPSSLLQLSGGVARTWAEWAPYSNWSPWVSLTYQQDLPWGFSVTATPSVAWSSYDAAMAGFGRRRDDTGYLFRIGVLNRRLTYEGFTPQISFVHVTEHSNIALYKYARDQFEIGLTRYF